MTLARGIAAGALVIAVVVVAVLLLSGGTKHEYYFRFENAGQLVKGDDVQIGGRRVGSVEKIDLTDDNQASIEVRVSNDFAPLHEGTTAIIRATSLSGIANRYIAVTPGPNSAKKLDDGAVLTSIKTISPVDLDQLFETFDPKTRKGLDNLIHGSAQQYAGVPGRANKALHYLNPALNSTSRLTNELIRDQTAFTNFVVDSSRVVTALAARRDDLSNLVQNSNTVAGAVASEDQSLEQALEVLPSTLRKANTTFVNLRGTLGDLDTLVDVSKPATRRLAPFLAQLRPLVASARPTIADLRTLIRRPGKDNDLVELLRKAPGLERVAKPAFANSVTALKQVEPDLEFIRPYAPELVGWFRDFGQGASNYDANGHYARIQPIFNAFQLTDNTLAPAPASERAVGTTAGDIRRCPGSATQAAPDKSNPYRDQSAKLDCDPSQVPPGP